MKVSCYYYSNYTVFNFLSLYTENGYVNSGYVMNFCKPFTITDPADSTKNASTFVYKKGSSSNTIYADGDLIPNSLKVSEDESGNRYLTYNIDAKTRTCASDSSKYYQATITVKCDSSVSTFSPKVDDTTDKCHLKIEGTHKAGCAVFQATALVEYFSEHPYLIGVALIVFGFVATFFGAKFFRIMIAIGAAFIVFIVILLLASALGLLNAL
jgi:hypothetical protein